MPMNEAEPTEAFRRTYSSLLAEEAGVPIEIMKEALVVEGRDEAARPKAVSAAQLIWSSRGYTNAFGCILPFTDDMSMIV